MEATEGTDAADEATTLRPRCKGDCHLHSDWSDGGSSIEEMALAAVQLGHQYMVLTDHSPRLKVAGGLSAGAAAAPARRGRRHQRRSCPTDSGS